MITETEKARLKELQDTFMQIAEPVPGDLEISPEDQAKFVGYNLAVIDVLFAIREGTEWQGLTDPKEISRKILRDTGLGDQ